MRLDFDFLVLGTGLAGLSFALRAAEHGQVCLVTKRAPEESNTAYAQGGIAAVLGPDDSTDAHIKDTITAGVGLCHKDIVQSVVEEGTLRVQELQNLGVHFEHNVSGELDLTREGGHSARRVAHSKDATGREVIRALLAAVKDHANIEILDQHIAIDIITTKKLDPHKDSTNTNLGAYVLDESTGAIKTIQAPITVLATGGAGKAYRYTSNPDIASGDGVAMAYRAGASIANLEFFQFHPTCLFHPHAKSFLITEALRGEGATLRNNDGTPFMKQYHERGDLAPRDIVARAIDSELKRRGDDCVYLDITNKESSWVKGRFPNIYKQCMDFGIDITTQPIPVVPAAHYLCGGVLVDASGETNVRNLFAIGEVSCTGLHGANRLASNSLLECAVFGARAANTATQRLKEKNNIRPTLPTWDASGAVDSDEAIVVAHNWDEVRRTLWNYVGVVRSNKRLARAKRRIALLNDEIVDYYWNFTITRDLIELRNIALLATLIVECASRRKESRGLHYTIDYPNQEKGWCRDTILTDVKGLKGPPMAQGPLLTKSMPE